MIVAKFGGSSVSSAKSIKTICSIVSKEIGRNPVVVVSALSGITDLLLSLHNLPKSQFEDKIQTIKTLHISLIKKLWKEGAPDECLVFIHKQINEIKKCLKSRNFNKAYLDKIASFGEIMSSYIIAKVLNAKGISAKQIIATNLIITDKYFGSAEFLLNPTRVRIKRILQPLIKKRIVPVITGFIGSTKDGQVTTLGRGGSDYTASIIGFCLDVQEIQIWTDVDGVFSTDPSLVKNAKLLRSISYREASELSYFGVKVLHPRTIRPASEASIPVRVLNTFNIKNPGTLIVDKATFSNPITTITFKKRVTLVNMYSTEMLLAKGFLVRIFDVFYKNNISIDLVSVSEVSVSVTLDNDENLENAEKELSKFTSVLIIKNAGIISLIGEKIITSALVMHRIFDILHKEKILVKMISLSAVDINISLVIQSEKIEQTVKVLHNHLLVKLWNSKRVSK